MYLPPPPLPTPKGYKLHYSNYSERVFFPINMSVSYIPIPEPCLCSSFMSLLFICLLLFPVYAPSITVYSKLQNCKYKYYSFYFDLF